MVPGALRTLSATAATVSPSSRACLKRSAAGVPLRVRSRLMDGELGQGHPGGVHAGAYPHISRPGQGGQALTLMR